MVKAGYYIKLLGLLIMFSYTLLLVHTFYLAYFSETKQVTIDINKYNEAEIEFYFAVPLAVSISIVSFVLIMRDLKNGEKTKKENM